MRSKYRLADRLLREKRLSEFHEMRPQGFRRMCAVLDEVIRVDVSDYAESYWRDSSKKEHHINDSGPLMPTYPDMWVEYEMPLRVVALNEEREWEEAATTFNRVGAYVSELDWESLHGIFGGSGQTQPETQEVEDLAEHILAMTIVMELTDGRTWSPGVAIVITDKWGSVVKHPQGYTIKPNAAKGSPRAEACNTVIQEVTLPLFLSIGLMNCKNVDVIDAPEPRRSKKAKKRGAYLGLDFRTIKLPDAAYRGGGKGGEGGPLRLHSVRGHFKTYTEEAPLLGKFTGTYWWSAQARGSKKYGEIVKDYEVSPQ